MLGVQIQPFNSAEFLQNGNYWNNTDNYSNKIPTKGQLISECLFEKIVWTKIPTKNLIDSAQQV